MVPDMTTEASNTCFASSFLLWSEQVQKHCVESKPKTLCHHFLPVILLSKPLKFLGLCRLYHYSYLSYETL